MEQERGILPGYHMNFVIYGVVYLVAALLWLRIDATKPIIPDECVVEQNQP